MTPLVLQPVLCFTYCADARCSLSPSFRTRATSPCCASSQVQFYNRLNPAALPHHIQHGDSGDAFVMVPLQSVKDEGEGAKPWLMVSRTRTRTAHRPLLAPASDVQRPVPRCRSTTTTSLLLPRDWCVPPHTSTLVCVCTRLFSLQCQLLDCRDIIICIPPQPRCPSPPPIPIRFWCGAASCTATCPKSSATC